MKVLSVSEKDFDTILQADSIETHHGSGLFVCGTYSLRNDSVSGRRWREGLIHLLDARGPLSSSLHSVSCGGVLDLKWSGQLLASVESEAGFALFRLSEDDDSGGKKKEMMLLETQRGKLDRKSQCLMQTAPESLINLSVDWQSPHRLAISHDDGSLSLWNVGNSEIQNVAWWDAHDNEAWIVAAHKQNVDVFWSGADDGLLRGWDSRAGFAKRKHTFQVKSEAGVTSIMPSVHDPHTWAVGGYDEELRLFDDRNTVAPLSRLPQLGGGVWRIKWHPENPNLLVLACMRGGFRIVSHESGVLANVLHYTKHEPESLAYGVDWLPGCKRVACCSFYDHNCSTFQFET